MPERMATLEERVRNMDHDLQILVKKVDEIHEIITKTKGARWVLVGIATLIAGVVSPVVYKLFPFLSK